MVEGSGIAYIKTVCDYVNLNPVRGSSLLPSELIQRTLPSAFTPAPRWHTAKR